MPVHTVPHTCTHTGSAQHCIEIEVQRSWRTIWRGGGGGGGGGGKVGENVHHAFHWPSHNYTLFVPSLPAWHLPCVISASVQLLIGSSLQQLYINHQSITGELHILMPEPPEKPSFVCMYKCISVCTMLLCE